MQPSAWIIKLQVINLSVNRKDGGFSLSFYPPLSFLKGTEMIYKKENIRVLKEKIKLLETKLKEVREENEKLVTCIEALMIVPGKRKTRKKKEKEESGSKARTDTDNTVKH